VDGAPGAEIDKVVAFCAGGTLTALVEVQKNTNIHAGLLLVRGIPDLGVEINYYAPRCGGVR
jgi:hypothetical protein